MCAMNRNWHRLKEAVRLRRAELGLSQAALAKRGGMSRDRVQQIEGAKRTDYSLRVLVSLETALGWKQGSVSAVLAGGDPTLAPPRSVAEPEEVRVVKHAPGVLERIEPAHHNAGLPDDGLERHVMEVRDGPGDDAVLYVSWAGPLSPDLEAILADVRAQGRLLERRARTEGESRDRNGDARNGTDG